MPNDFSFHLGRQKDCLLLTGATGLVGQYLMVELLSSGKPLAVMARSNRLATAKQRIEMVLNQWEHRLGRLLPRPRVIAGNLREIKCGIDQADINWMQQHVSSILHSGASVRFLLDESSNEPFASNVNGTIQLVNLALRSEVSSFHLISTAYVAGDRRGVVLEDELDAGQRFNNPYENSKFQSESYVRENAHNFDCVNIFRPSIVAGDSRDGFTTTFHTVYSALRFARCLPDQDTKDIEALFYQLKLSSSESKNIIHVDWLTKTIARVLETPIQNSNNGSLRSFHLTHPNPTTTREISNAMNLAIAAERPLWDALAGQFPRIDVKTAAATAFESFEGYLRDDPTFDQQNLKSVIGDITPPIIDATSLAMLFRFAIRNGLQPIRPRVSPQLKHDYRDILSSPFDSNSGAIHKIDLPPNGLVPASTQSHDVLNLHLKGPGGGSWRVDFDSPNPQAGGQHVGHEPNVASCRFVESPTASIASELVSDDVAISTTLSTLRKSTTPEKIERHLADGRILVFANVTDRAGLIPKIELIAKHFSSAYEQTSVKCGSTSNTPDSQLLHVVQRESPNSDAIEKPPH